MFATPTSTGHHVGLLLAMGDQEKAVDVTISVLRQDEVEVVGKDLILQVGSAIV
ncbi:MAG: hypothetical protein GY903_27560 [Fuerstiella sp.]|nr:hypothetical protein [Fuerstiella sp.]MCP4858256.1 hypothetical protein [Fuerstiella sp.]